MIVLAIILGILQGLTEFLPISSSGHLAILEHYFGVAEPVTLAVFLHFGTFLATLVYFSRPIRDLMRGMVRRDRQSIGYIRNICIGTIPIVIFAFLFKRYIEQSFTNLTLVALLLGITGAILILTGVVVRGTKKITLVSAVLIGVSQMFAVFPGISRSGVTIASGLFLKVKPDKVFTFSFLLSLPAIAGAFFLEAVSISSLENIPSLFIGMVFSFLSGLVALKILRLLVEKYFHLFGIYCLVISLIIYLAQ
ncbi:MAG: undecaprenyl-diphosphate phosphatase [candidate division WOR-3 bacterium]|nr:MAG: undecaprenyl-diphosphate phosphatase [candidate division WOR-3 bacterium]